MVEEIAEKTTVIDSEVIAGDANPDKEPSIASAAPISSTYQQGIDDFYQSQAESQKKKLDQAEQLRCPPSGMEYCHEIGTG